MAYSKREIGVYLSGAKAIAGPAVLTLVSFPYNPLAEYEFGRFVLYKRRFNWAMTPLFLDVLHDVGPNVMNHVITVNEINDLGAAQAYAISLENALSWYCYRHKIEPTAVRLYQSDLEGSFHFPCVKEPAAAYSHKQDDYLGFTCYIVSEARRRRLMTRLNRIFPKWSLDQHWGKGYVAKEEVWMWGPNTQLHRMEAVSKLPDNWYNALRKAATGRGGIYSYMLYDWQIHIPSWWGKFFEAEFLSILDGWEQRQLVEHLRLIAGPTLVSRKPPKQWEMGVFYSKELVQEFIKAGGRPQYNFLEGMRRAQKRLYQKRKASSAG